MSNKSSKPEGHHGATIHLGAESLQDLETAFNETLISNQPSKIPMIEMTIPTAFDKSLAPPGQHVATLFIQWTPYSYFKEDLKFPGRHLQRKTDFADRVLDIIDTYAPGFKNSVVGMDILTPPDLEYIFGLTGGNIFHGAMSLDQLYMTRPTTLHSSLAGCSGGYRTPIKNYMLCGSGSHPGGGVMGSPGRNAAIAALEDIRNRRF